MEGSGWTLQTWLVSAFLPPSYDGETEAQRVRAMEVTHTASQKQSRGLGI